MADKVVFSGGQLQLEQGGPVPPEAFPGHDGGEVNELVSRGDGASLVIGKQGLALLVRSLAAGPGIEVVEDGDVVRITATVTAEDLHALVRDHLSLFSTLLDETNERVAALAEHTHEPLEAPPDHVLTGAGFVPLADLLPPAPELPDIDTLVDRAVGARTVDPLADAQAALGSIAERARVTADVKSLAGIGGHLSALYRLVAELAEALHRDA